MTGDPFQVLEVDPGATEAELRSAYRRAVQRHHPDHNGGSAESARRFEEIQEAWVEIKRIRLGGAAGPSASRREGAAAAGTAAHDPAVEDRIRAMEDELRTVRTAREAAAREAREAAEQAARAAAEAGRSSDHNRAPDRPSDEDLGYIRTDDSFAKIFSDAREEFLGDLGEHSSAARGAADRAAEALEDLAAILRGKRRREP